MPTKNRTFASLGFTFAIGAAVITILGFMSPSESTAQGLPTTAAIQFGNTGVGSGFPPPSGHDESGNAVDKLIPAAVNIKAGGTVSFMIVGSNRHAVMVFPAGTRPRDVDTSGLVAKLGCGGANYITDPNGESLGEPTCNAGLPLVTKTFAEPGRYLVICSFNPHLENNMWGWVNVK